MDNEQVISGGVTVSDNEQGNKLHSKKTGRFVGKNGEQGEIDSELRKTLLTNLVKATIEKGDFGQRVFDTYQNADDNKKQELIDAIIYNLEQKALKKEQQDALRDDRNVSEYKPLSEIDTQGLSSNERKRALLSDTRLSKSAILNATDEEIEQLLTAQYLYDTKNKQINNDPNIAILQSDPNAVLEGVWMAPVGLDDYEQLKSNGRIDRKIFYFQNNYQGTDGDAIIQKILDYCAVGDKYLEIVKNQNLDTTEDQKIMEKFSNPDSPYSWKRKHRDAVYNENMVSSRDALRETNNRYGVETNKIINRVFKIYGQEGQQAISDYTHGFVWANDPLREQAYSPSGGSTIGMNKSKNWVENVQIMTDVLDLCSYSEDMWLTRGADFLGDPKFGIDVSRVANINDLVGMVFGDQGFVSTSASKINYTNKADPTAGQWKNKPIIQHIYAPSGSHILHTASSATRDTTNYVSGQDNNDYSLQNEFLIQRGYSYRITKAYYKGTQLHVDCDIILGSDAQKYDEQQLQQIERSYVI